MSEKIIKNFCWFVIGVLSPLVLFVAGDIFLLKFRFFTGISSNIFLFYCFELEELVLYFFAFIAGLILAKKYSKGNKAFALGAITTSFFMAIFLIFVIYMTFAHPVGRIRMQS